MSLAGITEKSRSIIKYGVMIAGALFLIYILFIGGIFVKNILFPTAPTGPEQGFGQLPEIVFEQKASPAINYVINTTSGKLPANLPTRLLVYKIAQLKPDLLALQNARNIASAAGFKTGEIKISENVYQWSNPTTNSVMVYDITMKNFEISSNLLSNQSIINNASFPNEDKIRQYVSEFLNSVNVNLEKLGYAKDSIKYYNFNGSKLIPQDDSLNAKVARINLYNNSIENERGIFPFVYPNPEFPLVTVLVTFPSSSRMVVLGGEFYNKILTDESSEYQIKTPDEAYSDLQSGIGYLLNPNNQSTFEITDVYLGYFLDKNINEYVQPVYIFEGIGGKAFVPAIKFSTQSAELTSE